MFGLLKRKHPASEVAGEIARLALSVTDDARKDIDKVSQSLGVPQNCVETEYRYLKVYIVETVVQTISEECDAGQTFLTAFHDAVAELAECNGISTNFWSEQETRTASYDTAWQDPRGIGTSAAMAFALAARIRSEDDLLEVMLLWLGCSNLLPHLLKYLRTIRIVEG